MKPFKASARIVLIALLSILLFACTTSPVQYTHFDESVDFRSYRSWGFYPKLGTDNRGYSTLITQYFKTAITREMAALGYTYSEENPQLLVNFSMSIQDKSEVRDSGPALGYFSYRHGLYTVWPLYDRDTTTINYKQGTANVDIIDAAQERLIWESVAEGRLSKEAMNKAEETISNVVREMFTHHPLHPRD